MATTISQSNTMEPQSSVKTVGFKVNNGESRASVPPTQQQQSALNVSGDSMNFLEIWRKPIIGELYIRAEYITYPVATSLIEFARLGDVPIAKSPLKILDVCCGTGVVSSVIQKMMRERSLPGWDTDSVTLTCADSSQAQLEVIQNKVIQEGWVANEVKQVDVMHQPFPSDHFDIAINSMALMLVADPYTALKECFRVTKRGGIFATSTWHTEGWVADTRDAIDVANLALPGQPPVSWPQSSLELTCLWGPGAWESPSFVKSMLRSVGFVDVEVDVVTKWIPFENVDRWVHVFEGLCMAATERFWTEKERKELSPNLMATVKAFLKEKYQEKPINVERTFVVARGRKPEV